MGNTHPGKPKLTVFFPDDGAAVVVKVQRVPRDVGLDLFVVSSAAHAEKLLHMNEFDI